MATGLMASNGSAPGHGAQQPPVGHEEVQTDDGLPLRA